MTAGAALPSDEIRLRRLLASAPDDCAAWLALASLLATEGRPGEACHVARLATAAAVAGSRPPGDPPPATAWSGDVLAEALAELAREFVRCGWEDRADKLDARMGEAEAAYLRALSRNPGSLDALCDLAGFYRDSGRLDEALFIARKASALVPEAWTAPAQVGAVLARMGRVDAAGAAYRDALQRVVPARNPGPVSAILEGALATGNQDVAAHVGAMVAAVRRGAGGSCLAAGRLFLDAKRPEAAVPWLRRAVAAGGRAASGRATDAARLLAQATAECRATVGKATPADVSAELGDALYRSPLLTGAAWDRLVCRPLGGGSNNAVFEVRVSDRRAFALRLPRFPRDRWARYWDEWHNHCQASDAGCAPAVLFMDLADGCLLTPLLTPVSAVAFADPGFLRRVGDLLRRLRTAGPFRGTFDVFANVVDVREEAMDAVGPVADVPDLDDLRQRVGAVRTLLAATAGPPAPSHNDPMPGNFVDGDGRLLLIDWQTAAMGDPDWDVGGLSAHLFLPADAEAVLFETVYGSPKASGAARATLYKAVAHYRHMIEGLIMRAEGDPDGSWGQQVQRKRDRLRRLVASPPFDAANETVRQGATAVGSEPENLSDGRQAGGLPPAPARGDAPDPLRFYGSSRDPG